MSFDTRLMAKHRKESGTMKFLSQNMEGKNLIPIHVYYSQGDYKDPAGDVLDFVYKDLDTGKKYVETIYNPEFEVWIVKPEFRNYRHVRDFIKKEWCTCHRIHYKTRYKEAAKLLGLDNFKDVKASPYISQIDMKIEHFYLMQFKHEYAAPNVGHIKVGYLDIESDMVQSTGKLVVGRDPINCISFLDGDGKTMYTFFLRKDFLPHVPETNVKYTVYENLRKKYYEQVDYLVDHINDFVKELHDMFDASYGVIDYQLFMFEDELELIKACAETIRQVSPDYWFVWNLPYDEESMIKRVEYHGVNPAEVFSDPEMIGGPREFYFKGDNNPKPQKRRHISNIFAKSIPVDQLPLYAGIRVSRGSLQSMKLNQIAKTVLGDSKLDYSEYGDFKYFCYQDFWKFLIYNIKDVLLQYGINTQGRDELFMADVVMNDCVLNYEIFTTTVTETMALRDFAFIECNKLLGINKNKLDLPKPTFSITEDIYSEEELTDEDFLYGETDDEEDEEDDGEKKEEKFSGAYVMSPGHIKQSGTKVMGRANKYCHRHVIDEDIGAELSKTVK